MRPKLSIFPQVKRSNQLFRVVLCCREDCKAEFLVDASKPITIQQIVLAAEVAGWTCDKRGYAVCPACRLEPKKRVLSPQQRRAAYVRIMFEEEADRLRAIQKETDFLNKRNTPKSWIRRKRRRNTVETATVDVRKPTPLQNRRIIDSLEINYDTEGQCYKGTWSDQRIAEELHFPRIWVSEVRTSFYGPEGNKVQTEALEEINAWIEKCRQLETDGLEFAARAETLEQEGNKIKERLGLPIFPKSIIPTTFSRVAVVPETLQPVTQLRSKKSRQLTDNDKQVLREAVKDIMVDKNTPMRVHQLLKELKKRDIDIYSQSRRAKETRLLRLLHEDGIFERIGGRNSAFWWPRGLKQK